MVGMQVVPVECDKNGNIDLADLKVKAEEYSDSLSAIMITYPSTHEFWKNMSLMFVKWFMIMVG